MAYTLITSIGTGMYKTGQTDSGYKKTVYHFPDGKEIETKYFMEALFRCRYREIQDVILIGTYTSSWDILLNGDDKLWEETYSSVTQKKHLDQTLRTKIEENIRKHFGLRKATIVLHTDVIDEKSVPDLFRVYTSVVQEIDPQSDILFDITHGFRSMPILLYQALQFTLTYNRQRLELTYGEYKGEDNKSYVRDLSEYWNLAQVSDAIRLFETTLDGTRLAAFIRSDWEACAKVIERITGIVRANFCLQIDETIQNIRNLGKQRAKDAGPVPDWLEERIGQILDSFLKLQDAHSQARTMFNYANLLADKGLFTQAIVALQVSTECAVAEDNGTTDRLGDYDWWQETGREKRKNLLRRLSPSDCEAVYKLERTRNQIAHGGAKSPDLGGFPSASNMPAIFKKGCRGVQALLEKIGL